MLYRRNNSNGINNETKQAQARLMHDRYCKRESERGKKKY